MRSLKDRWFAAHERRWGKMTPEQKEASDSFSGMFQYLWKHHRMGVLLDLILGVVIGLIIVYVLLISIVFFVGKVVSADDGRGGEHPSGHEPRSVREAVY